MVKNLFIEKTYVVRGNSNVNLQHMLLKKGRKLFGNLHVLSIMHIVFTFFKHHKLLISIEIPVTLLHIVYICMTTIYNISKIEFMNSSLLTC